MLTDLLFWGFSLISILFILTIRYMILSKLINHRVYQAERIVDRNREKAIKILTSVLSMEKDNTPANWLMAKIYYKSHHLILTRMYLNDILHYGRFTKEISETAVRELLADTYRHMGEYNKALVEYFILKKQNKLSIQAFKNALRLNIENSRYADARKFMMHALSTLKETDGEADYLMAIIDFHHVDFLSAESRLKSSLGKGYEKSDIYQLWGRICFIRAQYDDAISFFQKLPVEQQETLEITDLLGQSLYFIKDYQASIKTLERLIPVLRTKRDRTLAEPAYILGCAYELSGDLSKALQIWQEIEKAIPYYQNAVHKLYFYNTIMTDKNIQNLIIAPTNIYMEQSLLLLEKMEMVIKQKLFESDRTIEIACLNQKDFHPNYTNIIVITRETNAITEVFLQDKMNLANNQRGRYLTVIAPLFNEESLRFAEKNLITVHTFDIFHKYGIL